MPYKCECTDMKLHDKENIIPVWHFRPTDMEYPDTHYSEIDETEIALWILQGYKLSWEDDV